MRGYGAGTGMPEVVAPMLPAAGELPDAEGAGAWAVEFAWEGFRCMAHVRPGRVKLLSSGARSVTASFPELRVLGERLGTASAGFVLDGLVVALDEGGRPSRRPLMRRTATVRPSEGLMRRVPVGYVVTDLLWHDGRSLLRLPYATRRELLERLELGAAPIMVPPSFHTDEAEFVMQTAEQYGLDGLHLKRLDAPYQPGRRTRQWLRVPLRRRRQVVVGGWTPADPHKPDKVGAVLLGLPVAGGLRYVGRVGIGSGRERRAVRELMLELQQEDPPFTEDLPERIASDGRWVAPRIVAEVEYQALTRTGQLRLPAWQGLCAPDEVDPGLWDVPDARADPQVRDVPGEAPVPVEPAPPPAPPPAPVSSVLNRRLEQHFVYNSLNTIAAITRTDPGRARELLLGFAELSRAADRADTAAIPLADELEAVRAYLGIEAARFGRRLEFTVGVEPGVEDAQIAPLQLLDAVKATVQQRIEPRPEGGRLAVRAVAAGEQCVVTVTDEGHPDPSARSVAVIRLPLGVGEDGSDTAQEPLAAP
ncbi:MAG: histidine kinase [Pseudonocardia sp.]|nr:histidine kinase [Pseudonocardia sp.]